MSTLAARLSIALLLAAALPAAVTAQARSAPLGVRVEVLPTCAISLHQTDSAPRARLSCAGRQQAHVRAAIAEAPSTLVPLDPSGRGRSSADLPVSGTAGTRLLTIQF